MSGPSEDRYLTPRQVSDLTSLALPTLSNHRTMHIGIPYVKVGGLGRRNAVRYRLKDVIRYMEENRVMPSGSEQ